MAKLILVKHASPEVVPGVPPEQWSLSQRGRDACAPLAGVLKKHAPARIISSRETKAVETAELLAQALQIPLDTAADLHEHDRVNVPHMRSSDFISSMELFFRKPGELVLGRETAEQALRRFSTAVAGVVMQHPDETLAIVSHGTVIALLLAERSRQPAFRIWREMGLPSLALLDLPRYELIEIVARVG